MLWWKFYADTFNIHTWTQGNLFHLSGSHLGKALPLQWIWGIRVLDMSMFMSTTHVHSALHWIPTLWVILQIREPKCRDPSQNTWLTGLILGVSMKRFIEDVIRQRRESVLLCSSSLWMPEARIFWKVWKSHKMSQNCLPASRTIYPIVISTHPVT